MAGGASIRIPGSGSVQRAAVNPARSGRSNGNGAARVPRITWGLGYARLLVHVSSLARKYRPQTFSELVSQSTCAPRWRTPSRRTGLRTATYLRAARGTGKTDWWRAILRALPETACRGPTIAPAALCASCLARLREQCAGRD